MNKKKCLLIVILFLTLSASLPAHQGDDHEEENAGPPLILGVLDFPNSGAAEAQDAFTRGVLLLHSFEYDDARAAFQEAQATDPGFVMAVWGEAMTQNHPLWFQQDRDEALRILAKLPPQTGWKAEQRERDFLSAVTTLYGFGEENPDSKQLRDLAYRDAMKAMHEQYPDDLESASFYALSLLGSVYERDFRVYMQSGAILEEVFAAQPRHPGAAHYLIHSYDDQVHAPLGLRAARVYATIAPAASHAQHMISHIYTSLGMWDEVVEANIKSVEVSEQAKVRAGKPPESRSKHALHWLQYALLQQGQYTEARETMVTMKADRQVVPGEYHDHHYALFRGSYVADAPAGEEVMEPAELLVSLDYLAIDAFATAYSLAARGEDKAAQAELARLKGLISSAVVKSVEEGLHEDDQATSEDGYLVATIIARELEALLKYRSGDTEAAIELLRAAAGDENGRALEYGPPYVPKPASELLGEMLLEQGRAEEATVEFSKSLERNTSRALSLLGLYRAYKATGQHQKADEAQEILRSQWRGDLGEFMQKSYNWLN